MNSIFYDSHAIPDNLYNGVVQNIENIHRCRAPAGIPGNNVPRNVSVHRGGSIIKGGKDKILYLKESGFGKSIDVSYPMFQCAKSSTNIYQMRKIPKFLAKFILHLRMLVKKHCGNRAINVDRMFNVIICNNYTENIHQINAHRDDERWLEHNELNKEGEPCASIIASLTLCRMVNQRF